MYLKKLFLGFFLLSLPWVIFARVVISSLFPYTIDDTNLEYIEIRNTGCENLSLSWYILEDASGKKYIFPSGTNLESHTTKHISRLTSKIILNNEDEKIYIKDPTWEIIDQFAYLKSERWVIISIQTVDDDCTIISSWSTETDSDEIIWETGTITLPTQTGSIVSGEISFVENGTWGIIPIISTGSVSGEVSFSGSNVSSSGTIDETPMITDSGTTNSWGDISENPPNIPFDTGNVISDSWVIFTNTWVLFPEIFPTIQSPTNAVFGSGFFDCGDQNPCRINVNFEAIFIGSFLEKNYNCQIMTATGTFSTCNPSTMYFSTGSSFSLKLVSKSDPTQSKIVSWEVKFSQKSIESILPSLIDSSSSGTSNSYTNIPIITNSWITNQTILFPDIAPIFQSYTNTSFSWDIFICTTSPCRLNMTFESIFTGSFLSKNYLCNFQYGTGTYDTCNPPQIYLTGTWEIIFTLTEKISGEKKIKIFQVIQDISSNNFLPETKWIEVSDIEPPIPILEIDGKWKEYFYRISDTEMNCYSETCSLNFNADKSYDPWGWKIQFLWIFTPNIISHSRNPWAHSYGLWDHTIVLRVIDEAGNMSEILYHLHVLGKLTKEVTKKMKDEKWTTDKQEKAFLKILSSFDKKLDKLENTLDTKIIKERQKKQKKIKFTLFSPPELLLQWKTGLKISENEYHCIVSKNICKMNFSLTGTISWYRYEWIFGNSPKFIGKNPKSFSFPLGKNTVRILAYQDNGTIPIWEKDITVKITQKIKKKKMKKPKKVTVKKVKKVKESPDITPVSFQQENAGMMGIFLFLAWGGSLYVLKQRKKKINDL